MLSRKLLNLLHLRTCHVTLAWISSLDNPSSIHCINPVNLLGLNSHYVLCLQQCLSYNRYLITFVGWIKESIGLTFCLPDHLSQNVPLFLIILIMESWSERNVKTSILKSLWDVKQALEYIQKLSFGHTAERSGHCRFRGEYFRHLNWDRASLSSTTWNAKAAKTVHSAPCHHGEEVQRGMSLAQVSQASSGRVS